ncbi:Crp/Fnr family transcriptional regulator [Ramlibacter sp. AN1133]|uniref:Crp/Fnr family transcriptional regulator n=1 Tax=Ramlibacter sp. AN1133 TaxID=3133429 RepID=UPI0030C58B91
MPETLADLLHLYPALRPLGGELAALAAQAIAAPAGTILFTENDPCRGFPLLLEGEVRVSRSSPDGRSLELYRIVPGEVCLASSACLFRSQPLSAQAVTTRPARLLLVPPPTFKAWLAQPVFRDFVLGLYAERMADLTALVDEVAFQKLDRRLAAALLGHGPELAVTHQELANVLGTVREMVTRLLRRFEREGWIELARERIRIRDGAALRRVAEAG